MILDDKQSFNGIIMAGIQSGAIDMVAGFKIMREPDIVVGMRKFERYMEKKEKDAAAQEQARAEQEERMLDKQLQIQVALQNNKAQNTLQTKQLQGQQAMQELAYQGQLDKNNIYTQGQVDLTGKQLDIMHERTMPKPTPKAPAKKK
jgi:hypothetical protein